MYSGTIVIIMSSTVIMNFDLLMCSGNGFIFILMALSEVLSSFDYRSKSEVGRVVGRFIPQ
jgi:hypothetical protein